MSAVTSRPRVTSVSLSASQPSVSGAQVIADLCKGLSAAGRAAYDNLNKAFAALDAMETPSLVAVRQLQQAQATSLKQMFQQQSLPVTERLKVETLVQAGALRVAPGASFNQPLRALQQATTLEAAQQAQQQLLGVLEAGHHHLFTQQLVQACSNAALKVGFPTIETTYLSGGRVRVVSENEAGQALVTEIQAKPDREPSLATEVVGLHDGSCQPVLDAYDAALEAEGIRAGAPHRTFTGGVCELTATRDFVRRKVRPSASQKGASTKQKSKRRRRHNVVTQQQK